MEGNEFSSMSETVRYVIENYPIGHQYFGNELHNDVTKLYPKAERMYTDTLMRMMRRFCSHQYKTVDQNRSLYERVETKIIFGGKKNERRGLVQTNRGRNNRPQKAVKQVGEQILLF